MNAPLQLQLQGVELGYGHGRGYQPVVQGLDLTLERGQIGCLLGASGCGKTTVLRAISGFEPVHHGQIHIAGTRVADAQQQLPPEQRRVGLMFQDYALFPHLDVAANVGFGLRRLPARQRSARVEGLLEQVGLAGYARRYPHELSGGQQQRVALARALAPAPQLLLLDEPLGALDALTRLEMQEMIVSLWREHGFTVLLVTHDVSESVAMAERVLLIEDGKIGLDMAVELPHPRHHGTPRLAELEARVLNRVMRKAPAPVRAVKVG